MPRMFARALLLALTLCITTNTIVSAHALPGSVLTLSRQGELLNLAVRIPLEDLMIAAPELSILKKALSSQSSSLSLRRQEIELLQAYLRNHLKLWKGYTSLSFTLRSASFETAYHEHVGDYVLVDVRLTSLLLSDEKLFPLTLRYDALMHEVRSHRASIYWLEKGAKAKIILNFGYRKVEGMPQAHILKQP